MVAWDNASEETENQCTFNTDNKKMQNVGRLKQERTEDHKTTKSWNCIFQIIRHEADKTCIIILAYIQGAKPIIWWISSERERERFVALLQPILLYFCASSIVCFFSNDGVNSYQEEKYDWKYEKLLFKHEIKRKKNKNVFE